MSDGSTPPAILEAAVYDAYGNMLVSFREAPNFGFAGQYRYYADLTGLHYLKARYYDPGVGRFISRDPIGYRGGMNLYAYTDNQPVTRVDPAWLFANLLPWIPIYYCSKCIGIPTAAFLGCLAGGCLKTGTCIECFREIMCQYRDEFKDGCEDCFLTLIPFLPKGPRISIRFPPTEFPTIPPRAPP
ncbi:MAG: RHS repeat-associated core domain-containing protein [Armatimonadetes bacterium]|nr:RHS repeat-associated core domain-containing protein [Armatimonadota bacterium]